MCYEKPGPRCSGHTRTNFRAAKAKLAEANEDLRLKTAVLNEARTVEAEAALKASQEAHAQAVAELEDASEKYEASKKNRAVAMEAYREAKKEYEASPEGIKKNRIRSANPELTAEQRAAARDAAMEGALLRKERMEALMEQEKDDNAEVEAFMSQLATEQEDPEWHTGRLYHKTLNRLNPAVAHSFYKYLQTQDPNDEGVKGAMLKLAAHEDLPVTDLKEMLKSKDATLRLVAVQNDNMPNASRLEMLNDPDGAVRYRALRRIKTLDVGQLNKFSRDEDPSVRRLIAGHKLPKDTEERLATDNSAQVRTQLAGNTHISVKVAQILSRDPDKDVRKNLINNKNQQIASSVAGTLANDDDVEVRVATIRSGYLSKAQLDDKFTDTHENVRALVAEKTTNSAVLSHLSNDRSWEVRERVALNENTSSADNDILFSSRNRTIKAAALPRHKNLSLSELRSMTRDYRNDKLMLTAITQHPNASPALREQINRWLRQ